MPPSIEYPERYFEILFNILYAQNKRLLTEVAIRYKVPISVMLRDFLPKRKELREFLRKQQGTNVTA